MYRQEVLHHHLATFLNRYFYFLKLIIFIFVWILLSPCDAMMLSHYRKDEEGSPHIVQLEFTTYEGIAALQLVKDWSCRLVQSCDTHEKLINLLRSSKGTEEHYSTSTLPRKNSSDAASSTYSNNHLSRASRILSSLRQKSTRSKRRRKIY